MKTENTQKKNTVQIKEIAASLLLFLFLTFTTGVFTHLCNRPVAEIIRNTAAFAWGMFMMLFLWYQSKRQHNLEYDNETHPFRFWMVFLLCYLVSAGMVFAPASSWVFLSIMVMLAMFSNSIVGLTSGSLLLMMTVSLSDNADMYLFFLYFSIGLVGISLFRNLGLDFQVTGPLCVSGAASISLQSAFLVIFENQPFSLGLMIMPVLNMCINLVLLFLILTYFSRLSMYLLQDKYSEINDQEFPVMARLKMEQREAYFEAIHTAYLGERIARSLHMNDKAVKGCCYYYKLAGEKFQDKKGNTVLLPEYYEFPEELKSLISECQQGHYGSGESCVVLTSNKVIRSILLTQREHKEASVSYTDIIDAVFEKMLRSDLLKDCDISVRELRIMKQIYIEEKLYYDFLR